MNPINLSNLERKAQKLNAQSDQLTESLSAINEKLNSLNLGLEVFQGFRFASEEGRNLVETDYFLGYGKLDSKWGLLVRCEETEQIEDEPDEWRTLSVRYQFLLSAPRHLRVQAVDQIQAVVDLLEEEADKVEDAVAAAKKLAESL